MLNNYDIQRIENAIWVLAEYQCALADVATAHDYDAPEIYHSIYHLMKMSDDIFDTHFIGVNKKARR